jgi:hypothetical protein
MAEKLEAYEFTRGRPTVYRWDEWFDGSIWRLERSVDFPGATASSFRVTVYNNAAKRNIQVKAYMESDDVLVIQAQR